MAALKLAMIAARLSGIVDADEAPGLRVADRGREAGEVEQLLDHRLGNRIGAEVPHVAAPAQQLAQLVAEAVVELRRAPEGDDLAEHGIRPRAASAGFDDVDDLAHDAAEVVVLRRVDARDAHRLQPLGILRRDDAADDHRHVAEPAGAQPLQHLPHQGDVRAGEDGEADDMHAFLQRRIDDLGRRQADALIDHFHARHRGRAPRSARRRWNGRRGPACRPGS